MIKDIVIHIQVFNNLKNFRKKDTFTDHKKY